MTGHKAEDTGKRIGVGSGIWVVVKSTSGLASLMQRWHLPQAWNTPSPTGSSEALTAEL